MGIFGSIFGANNVSETIQEMLDNKAVIIDVRSPMEFKMGNVKGSKNIPLGSVQNKLQTFKKMREPIVLCCASGNRSGQAASFLKSQGVNCENGGSWTQIKRMIKEY